MKHLKLLAVVAIAIIVAGVQYLYLGELYLPDTLISDLIIFSSIVFGFYIASLTIFATSSFVANLYKKMDEKTQRTQLHTLLGKYEFGLVILLVTIAYLLITQFVIGQTDGDKISLANWWTLLLPLLVSSNFWHGYKMLKILLRVILQQAKKNAEYPTPQCKTTQPSTKP